MKKINIGIIGLGYIGKVHLTHCLKLDNIASVAVADVSKKALSNARNMGVSKTYSDYEEMLKDPKIDAVIIALPTHLHLGCAVRAAEEKKHILLEKPMARNPEEGAQILAVAQRNSVKLMMAYPLRFNETFSKIKHELSCGTLGEIESAYANNIGAGPFFHRADGYAPTPVPEWWWNSKLTGGGALIDLGSHMLNLLRWYFGEIKNIQSVLSHRFTMDFEDSAVCIARFEQGSLGILNVGWYSQGYKTNVDIFGTVKCASAENLPGNRLITAVQVLTTGSSRFFAPYIAELQYFLGCIIRDQNPMLSSGLDGLRDLEAISLAYSNECKSI